MSERIFLNGKKPLAAEVASVLVRDGGKDLSRVEVWVPTAGAARRIRRALAEQGVLSPRFTQPMRALLPTGARLAERFEREAAWANVLAGAENELLQPLFSDAKWETDAAHLKSAGVFCDLCDLLAEAGWSPAHGRIREVCSVDTDRWVALGELYKRYKGELEAHELRDPNEARFAEMANPSRAADLDRLVIACIPDLPVAAQRFAEALEKMGVRVEVVVWAPTGMDGKFDAWGRPDPDSWADCRLELDPRQIGVHGSPGEEARQAIDYAISSKIPGDYAVVLADTTIGTALRNEVESRGGRAFLPDGERLDLSEAGTLALEWNRFRSTGDLRVLRRLLELPRFNRVLRSDSELTTEDALAVCDYLIGEAVLYSFPQAEEFVHEPFDPASEKNPRREQARIFVELVKSISAKPAPDLIACAWKTGGEGLETARKVESLFQSIARSPLYRNADSRIEAAFARALKAEPVFGAAEEGDVELSGWLEAPWAESGRLVLCGCVEGCLPSSVNGHAFLPDSQRRALGLTDNAARFARDAYLFQGLLLARPAGDFRVSFSRFGAEGDPSLPSSLFLRCGEETLPQRVLELFGKLETAGSRALRKNNWKWNLPEQFRQKVEKISPTDFAEYLACPFRYYLKRVQWLDTFTPDAREMDAKRFGSLIHDALELFGKHTPHEADPAKIERLVLDHLDSCATRLFGPAPSPAVQIQIEAAKARLRGFARVQAEQFAAGWRILEVERKLESEGAHPLQIGPLKLSGKIDRIERNDRTGDWRVLDYKTHAKATAPSKKHFGPRLDTDWLPAAEVEFNDGKKIRTKRWADLQLPLYREILKHWHGPQIGDSPILTAYFALSADPSETAVLEFKELSDEVISSAMLCAQEIADRVHMGRFWPPQPLKSGWEDPFAALFLNGPPEACFHRETIAFLEGGQ